MSQCAKRASLLLPGNLLWLRGIELQTCYEGQHSVQQQAAFAAYRALQGVAVPAVQRAAVTTIEKGLLCKPPTVVLLS